MFMNYKRNLRTAFAAFAGASVGITALVIALPRTWADNCGTIWANSGPVTQPTVTWSCDGSGNLIATPHNGSYTQQIQNPCEGTTAATRTCTISLTDSGPQNSTTELFQEADSCNASNNTTLTSSPDRCCSSPGSQ